MSSEYVFQSNESGGGESWGKIYPGGSRSRDRPTGAGGCERRLSGAFVAVHDESVTVFFDSLLSAIWARPGSDVLERRSSVAGRWWFEMWRRGSPGYGWAPGIDVAKRHTLRVPIDDLSGNLALGDLANRQLSMCASFPAFESGTKPGCPPHRRMLVSAFQPSVP
jgi:hypothetical protein